MRTCVYIHLTCVWPQAVKKDGTVFPVEISLGEEAKREGPLDVHEGLCQCLCIFVFLGVGKGTSPSAPGGLCVCGVNVSVRSLLGSSLLAQRSWYLSLCPGCFVAVMRDLTNKRSTAESVEVPVFSLSDLCNTIMDAAIMANRRSVCVFMLVFVFVCVSLFLLPLRFCITTRDVAIMASRRYIV